MKKSCRVSFIALSLIVFVWGWGILGIAGTNESENTYHKRETPGAKVPAYDEIRKDNIKSTIEKLEQYGERFSWEKQGEAINWARGQFEKLGIKCWTETYESNGKTWPNLFARIEGKKNPSALIMVIAHIDSKSRNPAEGAPGADDNGSGVAILFEVARILRQYSLWESIQFCLFTNEEQGQKGSRAFARKARAEGQIIKAVMNLDVLGYNRPTKFFDWHALWIPGSLKGKGSAILRMLQNLRLRMSEGKDVLIVAGRPANGKLVMVIGDKIRESSGITAKEIVSDDCA